MGLAGCWASFYILCCTTAQRHTLRLVLRRELLEKNGLPPTPCHVSGRQFPPYVYPWTLAPASTRPLADAPHHGNPDAFRSALLTAPLCGTNRCLALSALMEAHVITAPGDGVAPAVLLSLPAAAAATATTATTSAASGQGQTQYLFNMPEGFSRLVLEHKLRPGEIEGRLRYHCSGAGSCSMARLPLDALSTLLLLAGAGLRAAFACDVASLAGLGGLVMRLRGEGHGQLHVVGPPGEPGCWPLCLRACLPASACLRVSPWQPPCNQLLFISPSPARLQAPTPLCVACVTLSTGATLRCCWRRWHLGRRRQQCIRQAARRRQQALPLELGGVLSAPWSPLLLGFQLHRSPINLRVPGPPAG